MVKEVEPVADIALIGLAVMGQNLLPNMNDHGFVVCAYNRTVEKVDAFLSNEAKGTKVSQPSDMFMKPIKLLWCSTYDRLFFR